MEKFFRGLYNIWYFRKVIWNYRTYDYKYTVDILIRALERMSKATYRESPMEDKNQVVSDINRLCEILKKDEYSSEWYTDVLDRSRIVSKKLPEGVYSIELRHETEKDGRISKRVVKKLPLWNKARLSTLGKILNKYQTWWY